jgi:hypothetical protein
VTPKEVAGDWAFHLLRRVAVGAVEAHRFHAPLPLVCRSAIIFFAALVHHFTENGHFVSPATSIKRRSTALIVGPLRNAASVVALLKPSFDDLALVRVHPVKNVHGQHLVDFLAGFHRSFSFWSH